MTKARVSACLGLVMSCTQAFSQATFLGVGAPSPQGTSFCAAVNYSGIVVVGYTQDISGTSSAFIWRPGVGAVPLNPDITAGPSSAMAMNTSGSVVVGWMTQNGAHVAFRWTNDGTFSSLGTLPGFDGSEATSVSNDGQTVVGILTRNNGANASFIWTSLLGMRQLGQDDSAALGISSNGIYVTGRLESPDPRLFRWPPQNGQSDVEIYTYCNGANSGLTWDNPIFSMSAWRPMIVMKTDHPSETGATGLVSSHIYNPPFTTTDQNPGVYPRPPETPAGVGTELVNWVRYFGDHHPLGMHCFDQGWGIVLWNVGVIYGPDPAQPLNIMPAVPGNFQDRIVGAPVDTVSEKLVAVSGVQSSIGLPLVNSFITQAMAQAKAELAALQATNPTLPDPKHWFMDQEANTATVATSFGCGPGIDNIMPSDELHVPVGWLQQATSSDPNADPSTYLDQRYRRASEGGAVLYNGLAWGDVYGPAARLDADGNPVTLELQTPTYRPANQAFLRWYLDKVDRITEHVWMSIADRAKISFPGLAWSNYNLTSRLRGSSTVPRSMIDRLTAYWDYDFTTQADCKTLACYPCFSFWYDTGPNTVDAWNNYLGLVTTGDAATDVQNIAVEVHKRRIRNSVLADPTRPLAIYLPTVDLGNSLPAAGVSFHHLSAVNARDIAAYAYEQGVRKFLFFNNVEAAMSLDSQAEILAIGRYFELFNTSLEDIGGAPGSQSEGRGLAPDGSIIVGRRGANLLSSPTTAMRWTLATGMEDLPSIPGTGAGWANGLSADGTIIVGSCYSPITGAQSAAMWSDGGVVDLNAYLPSQGAPLTGWQLTEATAVSQDGITITGIGIHNGRTEGWIATRPHCHSSDFNRDGDSGTDQDIEAFFACLAGTCCPACETVDVNGDGDVGTDADIEAFFRILAGGPC